MFDSDTRTCVLNNRGRGGMELKTSRLYCGANCENFQSIMQQISLLIIKYSLLGEDVEAVLNHIRSKNTDVKLIAVGLSLGGIVLGKVKFDF